MTAKLIKIDRNGTKYYTDYECPKCAGQGYIKGYEYIDNGRCFLCGGSGIHQQNWKEYTPEYAEKLEARRLARAKAKSAEKNAKFLERNGFDQNGYAWVVLGDTYKIKDELKALGCRFNGVMGWYSDKDLEGYDTLRISVDDCYATDYAGAYDKAFWLSKSIDLIKEANEALAPKTESEYVGEVGKRLELAVTLVRTAHYEQRSFSGYGTTTTYIYIMSDDAGNTLTWKTTSMLDKEVHKNGICHYVPIMDGDTFTIKGTVKEHNTYKGEKQTILTRCKVIA